MKTADQAKALKCMYYVVKPEMVEPLWNSPDPCDVMQDLLIEHIDEIGARDGVNY